MVRARSKYLIPAMVLAVGAARLFAQVTVPSTNVPLAIPDGGNVNSTLNYPNHGTLADVNLTFDISHSWDDDIELRLTGPSVAAQLLLSNCGGSGDNFTNTTLDQAAGGLMGCTFANTPFAGTFLPTDGTAAPVAASGTLNAFNGTDPFGTWTLNVTDDSSICTGTLNAWSLTFTGTPPLPGELGAAPVITSPTSASITQTTATLGGNVTSDNGSAVTTRGVVYSVTTTNNNPQIGGGGVTNVLAGSGTGVFTAAVTALTPGTGYSFKAYAINGGGTSYTSVATFSTLACPAITLTALPMGTVGSPYSASAAASGGTGPYTYSLSLGPLPTGLTLTPSGVGAGNVAGTPSVTGSFRVLATDANSCTGTGNIAVIGSAIAPGDLIIREFRSRGPAGAEDEYVEIANRTAGALTIAATDGSAGFGIASQSTGLVATILNGTVIPKGGFYLAANNTPGTGYSLSDYGGTGAANHDASWTTDLPDNTGIGLFRSATTFTGGGGGTVLDAVGFVGSSAPYLEGTGITVAGATGNAEVVYARNEPQGIVQDTGNNASDFYLADTQAGAFAPVTARLGTPGPQNLASEKATGLTFTLADPAKSPTTFPNRYRVGATATTGTYFFRWKVTNNTGGIITKLRVRVANVTTLNSPGYVLAGSQADFRLVPSSNAAITVPAAVTALGLTLEPPPAGLQIGGGYNSSALVTLPGGTLANGASVYINVGFQYEQAGSYLYFVSGEAK